MALIPVFHVVASELPIDPDVTTDIPQGTIVSLNSSGQIIACNGAVNYPLGVAGDSRSQGTTSYTATSGSSLSRDPVGTQTGALITGAAGGSSRFTQNRVADNYNEVSASGQMTVYHSGGEFWTDQYELIQDNGTTVNAFDPATPLYASTDDGSTGTGEEFVRAGRFTEEAGTVATVVGYVLTAPTAYPSGVPGTTVDFTSGLGSGQGGNSLSYGQFLHVKLAI